MNTINPIHAIGLTGLLGIIAMGIAYYLGCRNTRKVKRMKPTKPTSPQDISRSELAGFVKLFRSESKTWYESADGFDEGSENHGRRWGHAYTYETCADRLESLIAKDKPTTPAPTWTKLTPQSITTELRVSNKLFIEVISNHDKTYCYQPVWAFNEAFFDDIEDAKAQSVAFVMAELETALDGLKAYQGGAE